MVEIKRISDELHQRVLGYAPVDMDEATRVLVDEKLAKFGLADAIDGNEDVDMAVPSWLGYYRDHIKEAVGLYGTPYIRRLNAFVQCPEPSLPPVPPVKAGWQHFVAGEWVRSGCPQGTMILDFETMPQGNIWVPGCCAVYEMDSGWYVWQCDPSREELASVIEFTRDNLVVNHNVGYDRQYLGIEYDREDSGNRFFDTMSAFIRVRGMGNQQRIAYKSGQKHDNLPHWASETAVNSLSEVHRFYTGEKLDKGVRYEIVKEGRDFYRRNMAEILQYCLSDVIATFRVFVGTYSELQVYQPSPTSLSGQLLLGSTWVPMSRERWPQYVINSDRAAEEVQASINEAIRGKLDQWATEQLPLFVATMKPIIAQRKKLDKDLQADYLEREVQAYVEQTMSPEWHWLDWSPALSGATLGRPKWFRDIKPETLTQNHRVSHTLLGVRYFDQAIHWKDKRWYAGDAPVPHPEDEDARVLSLFTKGFTAQLEDGVITTANPDDLPIVKRCASLVNWVSFRERAIALHTEAPNGYPVALPQLNVTGTVTGRCADTVFQVMSNPKPARIGTEFKSLVEAPEGYVFVGADVSSQEMWIASLYGDSKLGFVGSTPLAVTILIGNAATKTTVHDINAEAAQLERDPAKALGFGALYGQGLSGAIKYIRKHKPRSDVKEIETLAKAFQARFKGRLSNLTGKWVDGLASEAFNAMDELVGVTRTPLNGRLTTKYVNKTPKTPVLKVSLPRSLQVCRNDYATTCGNWTIQASGVDFRDILVVMQRYFFDKLGVEGRLVLTIHDEIRTMVREDQAMLACYALQLAHLIVRVAFTERFGLNMVPTNVAWFDGIEVDRYLRKKVSDPCLTPSQNVPLQPGYTVIPKQLAEWLNA